MPNVRRPFRTGSWRSVKNAMSRTEVSPTSSQPAIRRSIDPAVNASPAPNANRNRSRKNRRKPLSRCKYRRENDPIRPLRQVVNASSGKDNLSAISVSGNEYRCTSNQAPRSASTGAQPLRAICNASITTAAREKPNTVADVRVITLSEGWPPSSHHTDNTRKGARGAPTANMRSCSGEKRVMRAQAPV
jgi:hypothetical protein